MSTKKSEQQSLIDPPDAPAPEAAPKSDPTPKPDPAPASTAKPKPEPKADPWSLDALRLSQNFDEAVGASRMLVTVPVRKPTRQEFIRVRPGDEWRVDTAVLDLKDDNEFYLIHRDLWPDLSDDVTFRRLVVTINRRGVLAVWPLKLPGSDGRLDNWSKSALAAAEIAEAHWTKLQASRALGAYEIYKGADDLPEPEWPEDYSFRDILDKAFGDYRIDSLEHPVIKRLHGLE